ncbi:hypothetical protein BD769DRAFT_1670907 [Suillus cothurnatus]|nr:hypothetical protein BD769DRAFT_1670907 [Suillus cothurnatus]
MYSLVKSAISHNERHYSLHWAQLTNEANDDHQAIEILANLWRIQNKAVKHNWDARVEAEAHKVEAQHREAAQEEEQCQLALKADQEAVIQEECKKNKAKYAPVKDLDVPSDPIILPCQYAKKHPTLHSHSTFTADEDALVMMPTTNSLNKWIPASAARDPKAQIIKDESLTWEQFNKAAPCMITLMKENDWPNNRVNMFISFWSALQNHRWHHDFDIHK